MVYSLLWVMQDVYHQPHNPEALNPQSPQHTKTSRERVGPHALEDCIQVLPLPIAVHLARALILRPLYFKV